MGKGIVYRYVSKKTGKPLRRCFECGGDLTDPVREGVLVWCVDAGESRPFDSVLLADGTLIDNSRGSIARGFHAGTYCGRCDELLINMSDVVEELVGDN